jgi:hypothetical protein
VADGWSLIPLLRRLFLLLLLLLPLLRSESACRDGILWTSPAEVCGHD